MIEFVTKFGCYLTGVTVILAVAAVVVLTARVLPVSRRTRERGDLIPEGMDGLLERTSQFGRETLGVVFGNDEDEGV